LAHKRPWVCLVRRPWVAPLALAHTPPPSCRRQQWPRWRGRKEAEKKVSWWWLWWVVARQCTHKECVGTVPRHRSEPPDNTTHHTSSRAWLCLSKSITSVIANCTHSHSFVASHMRIRSLYARATTSESTQLCLTCLSPHCQTVSTQSPPHIQPLHDMSRHHPTHHVHARTRTCTRLLYVSLPQPPMGNSLTETRCVLLLCFRVRFYNLLRCCVLVHHVQH
jgi:hypothetical protein